MRNSLDFNFFDYAVNKYNPAPYSAVKLKSFLNYADFLFARVPIKGKSMIDIGAGLGLFSLYGACSGADLVVALEPELGGSRAGVSTKLDVYGRGFPSILVKKLAFQEYESGGALFDIVLLHNSINHLDEDACSNLLDDPGAANKYRVIFDKIGKLAAPGATLIICDCSRYNIFARFKLRNPLSPTIRWEGHQSPELWAAMLSEHGFGNRRIVWRLPKFPVYLSGVWGKALGYLTHSHFCLFMEKL